MGKKRVGIVLFHDIEVLDFCGPFEVFSVARLNEERRREEPSPFEVLLVAERNEPVVTTGGMKVIPDHTFESCPKLDILVVPGGWGTRKELRNPTMLDWLRSSCSRSRNPNIGLYWFNAPWVCWLARWLPCNNSLALSRLDARFIPIRDGRI